MADFIPLGIDLDVQDTLREIQKLEKELRDAFRRMAAAADNTELFEEAKQDALGLAEALDEIRKGGGKGLASVEARAKKLAVGFKAADREAKKLNRELKVKKNKELREAEKAAKALARAETKAEKEAEKLRKELQKSSVAAKGLNGLKNALSGVVASLAAIASIRALGKLAVEAAKTGIEIDNLKKSLEAIKGTQEEATAEFNFVVEVAQEYGFAISGITRNYAQLIAATKGSALEGEKTRKIFESLTLAMRATGGTSEDLSGAIRAVQQIISKSLVSAEELRSQLGDRLPGAAVIAAKAIQESGESITEATRRLDKMLRNGEIIADEFLPRFAEEMEKTFGEALPAALQSAEARLNRFKNEFLLVQNAFAEPFLETALGGLEDLSKNSRQAQDGFALLGREAGTLIAALSAFATKSIEITTFQDKSVVAQESVNRAILAAADAYIDASAEANKFQKILDQGITADDFAEAELSIAGMEQQLAKVNNALTVVRENSSRFSEEGYVQTIASLTEVKNRVEDVKDEFSETIKEQEKLEKETQKLADAFGKLSKPAQSFLEGLIGDPEKIKKDADLLVESFEFLDGKGKLTAGTLEVLSEEAKKLVESFETLGEKVPDALQAIADAASDASEKFEKASESIQSFARSTEKRIDSLRRKLIQFNKAQTDEGSKQRRDEAKKLVEALEEEEEALKRVQREGALTLEQSNELATIDGRLADAKLELAKAIDDLGEAQADNSDQVKLANTLLDESASIADSARGLVQRLSDEYGEFTPVVAAFRSEIEGEIESLERANAVYGPSIQNIDFFNNSVQFAVSSMERQVEQTERQEKATKGLGDATKVVTEKITKFGREQTAVYNQAAGGTQALEELSEGMVDFGDASELALSKAAGFAEVRSNAKAVKVFLDGSNKSWEKFISETERASRAVKDLKDEAGSLGGIIGDVIVLR